MTAPRSTRVASQGGGLLEPVRDEGRTLDGGTRADFERAMGVSFGDVIVHSGPASTASTESWDAAAYTVGRHIVFNSGRYDPGTLRGRSLLAHELTHVAQQRAGGGDLDLGFRMPGSSLPVRAGSAEAEAAHAAGGGTSEGTAGVTGTGIGVAMQSKTAERAAASDVFQYKDAGGTVKRVSKEEGERLRAEATRKLRVALLGAKDMAAFGRSIHDDHIKQTQASSVKELFTNGLKFGGTVSNMIAGVVPPSLSMWHHPTYAADLGLAALERGDLKAAASSLRRATLHLDDAQKEWSTYIQTSIGGAESFLEQARVLRRPLSALHGVLTEVAQIVDTGLWVVDEALSPATPPGVPKSATPPTGIYSKIKAAAAKAGLTDTNNGALSITGVLHKTFDESDRALATEPESDSILTESDLWQLGGQAGAQAGLAYVGVTEVKYLATALRIAGTVGAIKGVSDSIDHHRRKDGSVDGGGLAKDPDFWVAVGNLMITAIGHRASRVGSKLVRILVASAPSLFAGTREFERVLDAYALPEGPKRNAELKTAVMGLIRIAIQGLIQVATNRMAARPPGGGPKKPAPTQGESETGTGAAPAGHQPETPAAGAGTQPKSAVQPPAGESAPAEPVAKAVPKQVVQEPVKATPKPIVEEPASKATPVPEKPKAPVVEEPASKATPVPEKPKAPVVEEPASKATPVPEKPKAPVVEEPKAKPKAVVEKPKAVPKPVVEEPKAVVEERKAMPKPDVEEPTSKAAAKAPVEEPVQKAEPVEKAASKAPVEEPVENAPAKTPAEESAATAAPVKGAVEEPPAAVPKPVIDEAATQVKPPLEESTPKIEPKPVVGETPAKAAKTLPAGPAAPAEPTQATPGTKSPSGEVVVDPKAVAKPAPDASATKSTMAPKPAEPAAKASAPQVAPVGPAPVGKKPLRLSEARKRAEAGERILAKRQGQLDAAVKASNEAAQRLASAKSDVASAQKALDEHQPGGPPASKLAKALDAAKTKATKAQTAHADAIDAQAAAAKRLAAAKTDAAQRNSAHEEAKVVAAAQAKAPGVETEEGRLKSRWDRGRAKLWKRWAAEELSDRDAGRSQEPKGLAADDAELAKRLAQAKPVPKGEPVDWENSPRGIDLPGAKEELNPLKAMTRAELEETVKTGVPASRLGAEVEHSRIPQRVAKWFVRAGMSAKLAASVTKQSDPDNTVAVSRKHHGQLDEHVAWGNEWHQPDDPMSSLDRRMPRPLADATNAELQQIVDALRGSKVDLDMKHEVVPGKSGQRVEKSLRDIIQDEMAKRPEQKWEPL